MNHVFKATFLTVMLTMALIAVFGQQRIYLSVDSTNDTVLILSDRGRTPVRRHDKVSWIINSNKIISFALRAKPNNSNIFTTNPEGPQAPRLDLEVAYWVRPLGGDWNYSIDWIDAHHNQRHYDPKIAVKPMLGIANSILLFGLIITSITALVFYRKWAKTR